MRDSFTFSLFEDDFQVAENQNSLGGGGGQILE